MTARGRTSINRLALMQLLRAIMDGPATVCDLVEASGLCYSTVQRYTLAMRREGLIRVARWDHDTLGRPRRPCYAFGDGPDAKRKRMSRAEIARASRERVKQRAIATAWARVA